MVFCARCALQHSKIGWPQIPGRVAPPDQLEGRLSFHLGDRVALPLNVRASACTGCGLIYLHVDPSLLSPPPGGEARAAGDGV